MDSDRILRVWKDQPGCSVETDLEADSCIRADLFELGCVNRKGSSG